MRIKSVHLTNYKRFTNLLIHDIPESARLVVLIGPNGTGKSSLFDAFLLKSKSDLNNYNLEGTRSNYYYKDDGTSRSPGTTAEVSQSIDVQFHCYQSNRFRWSAAFNIRSPYRSEADFQLSSLERVKSATEIERFERIIDLDQAVSDNYKRMTWKRMMDLDRDASGDTTFETYRKESLGELQTVMRELFTEPVLKLQDFGGLEDSGVFRFSKGTSENFHYKNLSGGEKAAFDLLLDIFVKREEYQDAIYCVDEPEAHLATALHGPLLEAMLELVPEQSQLWIATHSVGFVRKAYDMMRRSGDVVFLDFSEHDFDQCVKIRPRIPDRSFWQTNYQVALDDLADLIAPDKIILCEGDKNMAERGFDAKCYNLIFAEEHSDSLFISRGSSSEVERSEDLIGVLRAVVKGSTIWKLIDRDNMTCEAREEKISEGILVLSRRELENYLYDPEVLQTFLRLNNREECADRILKEHKVELLSGSTMAEADLTKDKTRDLFAFIKKSTQLGNLGNKRDEFALYHLAPALRQTPAVYQELRADVFQ